MAFGGNSKHKTYTKQDGAQFSTKGEWKNGPGSEWIHDNDNLCKPKRLTTRYGVTVPEWSEDDIAAQCDEVVNFDFSNWKSHMAKWGSCAQQVILHHFQQKDKNRRKITDFNCLF